MPTKVHLVHRTRRRVRLRVPDKFGDAPWFAEAESRLTQLGPVSAVQVHPVTASLILEVDPSADLDSLLAGNDLFDYQANPPPIPGAAAQVKLGLSKVDRLLKSASNDSQDLRSLMFLLILILAGVQMARGKIMVPALSLLWYAMELVLGARASKDKALTETSDEEA